MKPAAALLDRRTGAEAGEDHGGAMAEPSRDILNALLDQIEGAVELVERHGGGAALRARLARLLPAEEGATVRTTAAAGGPAEGGPENRHAGGMAEPSTGAPSGAREQRPS